MTVATSSPALSLAPAELVDTVLSTDQRSFLMLYGDTMILLVRIGSPTSELALALGATATRGREGVTLLPVSGAMEFQTVTSRKDSGSMRDRREEPRQLAQFIEAAPHFAVSLRKRVGGDTGYKDRISVGRARNKDIVLRHPSVSKFHAWFEVDESGCFHLTDADSKNRTRINGTALFARERNPLQSGDTIRFGAVESYLCAPDVLWTAVRNIVAKRHT